MSDMQEPKPGIYTHFKGKLYFVAGVGKHSETEEKCVVYYPLYPSETPIWVRPLSGWNEPVDKPEYKGERFTFVQEGGSVDLLVGSQHYIPEEGVVTKVEITGYRLEEGEVFVDLREHLMGIGLQKISNISKSYKSFKELLDNRRW